MHEPLATSFAADTGRIGRVQRTSVIRSTDHIQREVDDTTSALDQDSIDRLDTIDKTADRTRMRQAGAEYIAEHAETLHVDQGPEALVDLLRTATKDFVLAVRAKEDLRTVLGVQKLKKVKKKDATPEQLAAIPEVRAAREATKKRYQELKKTCDAYLKQRPSAALLAQINQIDETFREVDAANDSDTASKNIEESRSKAQETAAKIGLITRTMVLSESRFGELKRSVNDIVEAGVGSSDKSASFSFNFKVGVSKVSNVTAKAGLGYSGSLNIQDDRKFRVSHSLALTAGASAELAGVLSASAAGELSRAKTEVFTDADHWAAVMSLRLNSFTKKLYEQEQLKGAVEEEYDPATAKVLLQNQRLAEDGTTKVTATKLSGSLEAGVLGSGIAGTLDKSWSTFEKNGETKESTQVTKSFTVKPAGDLSIAMTWTNIRGHANPDNDGDYWNLKLSASAKLAAILQEKPEDPVYEEWEQNLREKLGVESQPDAGGASPILAEQGLIEDAAGASDAGYAGGVVKAVTDYLGTSVAELKVEHSGLLGGLELGVEQSASRAIEWNFVKTTKVTGSEGLVLQYRRVSGSKGMSASGSVPLGDLGAASVSLGVSASKSRSTMISEKVGTNTLTYLLTVFNGLTAADDRDVRRQVGVAGRWETYLESHEKEAWAALSLLKVGQGAAGEIRQALADGRAPKRPPGVSVSESRWAEVRVAGTAASLSGGLLLDEIKKLDASVASASEDPAWVGVKAALSAYLRAQGEFDREMAGLTWS